MENTLCKNAVHNANLVGVEKTSTSPTKGQPWTVPNLNMQFVYVEPGTFQMGSNDRRNDQKPVHTVTISHGYWIGKNVVTQNEYQSIMDYNPSCLQGGKKPVEDLSWDEAASFCQQLTCHEQTAGRLPLGYKYCLPTEAQWEFAARGGVASKGYRYSGGNNLDSVAWYYENSGCKIHDAGTKSPNELGIYDMSGNVWEWCNDWHAEYSRNSVIDPAGATEGELRVYRGGGWSDDANICFVTFRGNIWADYSDSGIGFRVALASSKNHFVYD